MIHGSEMGEKTLYELRGRTLQVYVFLLRRGEAVGVRELQRALGFSSPSVAHHHLEKLKEMGVAVRDESGRYRASEKVDVGVLKMFILLGGRLFPRLFFYAVFFTTLITLYILHNYPSIDPYALTFAASATLILWYETIRLWLHKHW